MPLNIYNQAVPRRSGPKIPKRTLTLEDVDRASKHRRTEVKTRLIHKHILTNPEYFMQGPDGPKSAESDRTMVNQIPVGNAFREPPVVGYMINHPLYRHADNI